MTVPTVRCPDCGDGIELPPNVEPGDLVDCPNCAGHALRVRADGGGLIATLAHRVSCPECGRPVTLPEDAKAGDLVECCGRRYRLTFEYGAFAAEEEAPMGHDRWLVLGVIGAALSCLACLTPVAVLALGAIGLGAWTGHLDVVLLVLLVGFVA